MRGILLSFYLVLILSWAGSPNLHAAEVEFNRDIRPILADKCFHCHGPDEKSRKADLRLDNRDGALADLGGYAAVRPGKAAESELMRRVVSHDSEERMPPAKSNKSLSAEEIGLLEAWINQGAEYQSHWAFLPIAHPSPPDVKDAWVKNPIDRFILARLQAKNLRPSGEAEPYTLARRLSLDLIGLPPEPAAVETFAATYKANPDEAVRALAEGLLANPHYGERWGRHWLDQARYADSNGYTIDSDRTMWPYRDWVIRAINDDMPFDQFTIEQLAGDLLPNPAKSQLVATGFHRNTLINGEGGTDPEQFRNEEVVDRVNTTGAVWLGLTLGCAQCHTHKFDPITQREYYEFFAFFNHGVDVNNAGPTQEVSEGEMLRDLPPAGRSDLDAVQGKLAKLDQTKAARQAAWEKRLLAQADFQAAAVGAWKAQEPIRFSAEKGAELNKLADHSLLAANPGAREVYSVELNAPDAAVAAVRLRVLTHVTLPANGPGTASNGNLILTAVEVWSGNRRIPITRAEADHEQPGYPAAHLIDGKPATGWAINVGKATPKDVKMNANHEVRLVLAETLPAGSAPLKVILRHESSDSYIVGRFALDVSPTAPGPISQARLVEALKTPAAQRTADQKTFLTAEFDKADKDRQAAAADVARVKQELGLGATVKVMVMNELAKPRETYIHLRGDFLRLDKATGVLSGNVPAALPALPKGLTQPNRLDLAKWLVDPANPLTARVTVNRVWMRYFGRGLVETENDFGTQGSYPTHPELLDWLATYFQESGWSMKALHELIVTSATYRQSSRYRPELEGVDALNLLLARQNRLRADAEIIRDVALTSSGLLNPKIGGPSVRPPQPAGVYAFTQNDKKWVADSGPNRYRRALYTQFYRSAPYPMLTTFDSPDFQSVCTRRPRTNTPLQALTMANDAAFVEMARGMAGRLLREVPGDDSVANRDRVRRAYQLCFGRTPADEELEAVIAFQERQAASFREGHESAEAVLPIDAPKDVAPAAAASWTAVARVLMNTDEFITRE